MRSRILAACGAVAVAASAWAAAAAADGIDVSWPQCAAPLPAPAGFAVVGVNGGRPLDADNPCLAAQVAWAGASAGFYANTANRGPASAFWPGGQIAPRLCVPGTDSLECAEDYGWNAAADSYARAVAAQVAAGVVPAGATRTAVPAEWWLDVETANTWRDPASNVAVLRGAVGYLTGVGAARVGFYSNPRDWTAITGGTSGFSGYASWVAGLGTRAAATARCGLPGFTGGGVAMAQYDAGVPGGGVRLDGDVRCPVTIRMLPAPPVVAARVSGATSVSTGVVQGAPLTLMVSTASPAAFLSPVRGGPFTSTVSVVIPAGMRSVPVYLRSRRAGVVVLRAASVLGGAAARVTVRPAPAVRLTGVGGPRVVRRGGRIVLVARAVDAFGNRSSIGVRWRSLTPGIASVRPLADGRALVSGLRNGSARIRVGAGGSPRVVPLAVRTG